MKFNDILTERLKIVEYSDVYLDQIFAYRSLPQVYEPYTLKIDTIKDLQVYFKDNLTEFNCDDGYSIFLIILDGFVIGEISLSYWDNNNEINEIGFAIHPKYQKNGYASEALIAFIDFLFKEMKRNRIQAGCDYDNIASRKLLEKVGLKMEGHFKQSKYKNDSWVDTCYYAVLSEDWLKK